MTPDVSQREGTWRDKKNLISLRKQNYCLFYCFFYYLMFIFRGTAKTDTRTEQLFPTDTHKKAHFSQEKQKNTGRNQTEYANLFLSFFLLLLYEYCFNFFFT